MPPGMTFSEHMLQLASHLILAVLNSLLFWASQHSKQACIITLTAAYWDSSGIAYDKEVKPVHLKLYTERLNTRVIFVLSVTLTSIYILYVSYWVKAWIRHRTIGCRLSSNFLDSFYITKNRSYHCKFERKIVIKKLFFKCFKYYHCLQSKFTNYYHFISLNL